MKAKPPFQLLVVDDNGRELYSGYVTLEQQPTGLNINDVGGEQNMLIDGIRQAITNPTVDKDTSKWYAF
jgi:hypothetical protein